MLLEPQGIPVRTADRDDDDSGAGVRKNGEVSVADSTGGGGPAGETGGSQRIYHSRE